MLFSIYHTDWRHARMSFHDTMPAMNDRLRWPRQASTAAVLTLAIAASSSLAAQVEPTDFAALRWRSIGPFRAGRVSAVVVDPSDPNIYYFGTPGGGVW